MAVEKKIFLGGLDRDSDLRFVKPEDYRDALNAKVYSSENEGDVGVVSNMKGAEEIFRIDGIQYFGSDHEVIGAIEDPSFDRVIFFVAWTGLGDPPSGEADAIIEYNLAQNICYPIIIDESLNFNRDYRVNDAQIIAHKQDFSPEGVLYFTDNYNPPRRINIAYEKIHSTLPGISVEVVQSIGEKFKYKNLSTGFEYDGVSPTLQGPLDSSFNERINAARIAPLVRPTVNFATDTNVSANYLRGKMFKFIYRYQFKDKQYSAWSPASEVIGTEKLTPTLGGAISSMSDGNVIAVEFSIDSSDVESVEIAVRDVTNSDSYGLADTLSYYNQDGFFYNGAQIESNFLVNTGSFPQVGSTITYNFLNNETYPAIDLKEATKLFNAIPIKAKTQTILDGGRIAYGNVVSGRSGFDSKLEVERYDAGDLGAASPGLDVNIVTDAVAYRKTYQCGVLAYDRCLMAGQFTVKLQFPTLPVDANTSSVDFSVLLNNIPWTTFLLADDDDAFIYQTFGRLNIFENASNPPGTPASLSGADLATTFYNSILSNTAGGSTISAGTILTDASVWSGTPMITKDFDRDNGFYVIAGHANGLKGGSSTNGISINGIEVDSCDNNLYQSVLDDVWDDITEHSFITKVGNEIIFRWSVVRKSYNDIEFRLGGNGQDFGVFSSINRVSHIVPDGPFPGDGDVLHDVVYGPVATTNMPDDFSTNQTSGSFNPPSGAYDGIRDDWPSFIVDNGGSDTGDQAADYNGLYSASATRSVTYTTVDFIPTSSGFKSGAWHNFGVVYYDNQGRSSAVQAKTSLYIPSHLEYLSTTAMEKHGVKWCLGNVKAPSWATKYQVVYTGNRNIRKFEQFITNGIHSSTLFPDLIFIDASSLYDYMEVSGGQGVDARFEPGDRIRILNTLDATKNALVREALTDFGIVDVVEVRRYTPEQNDEIVGDTTDSANYTGITIKGKFINVTRELNAGSGIATPARDEVHYYYAINKSDFNQNDVWKNHTSGTYNGTDISINSNNTRLANSLVEVYSLRKEIDENQLIFHEFDKVYQIQKIEDIFDYCIFTEGSNEVLIDDIQYPNGAPIDYVVEGATIANANALPFGATIESVVVQSGNVVSFTISELANATVSGVTTTFLSFQHDSSTTDCSNKIKFTKEAIHFVPDDPNGDIYTRGRNYRVESGLVSTSVESYHFSDFYKSGSWNKGRPNKELVTYHESRKPNTIVYTDSLISNTYVNGLNSSYEDEYIAEFDQSHGSIQKIYGKNNFVVIFLEDKILKSFVERQMTFTAQGESNLALSSEIISKSVPYPWEGGIGLHPESFAVYGDSMFFFDSQRGEVIKIQGDQIQVISNNNMSSYFSKKAKQLALNDDKINILGGYDVSSSEYVLSFEADFVEEEVELCELASESTWNSFETYPAGTGVTYEVPNAVPPAVTEIIYIALVQNTGVDPYSSPSTIVNTPGIVSSNSSWAVGDTVLLPGGDPLDTPAEITVNTITEPLASITLGTPGGGGNVNYVVGEEVHINGGQNPYNPAIIQVDTVDANGAIVTFTILDYGNYAGYNVGTTGLVSTSQTGNGTGATFDVTYSTQGAILTYSQTSGGSYTLPYNGNVSVVGGGASGSGEATFYCNIQSAWIVCSGATSEVGCTDPIATNYNSGAIFDDGSCEYDCLNVVFDAGCGEAIMTSSPSTVDLTELVGANLVDQATGEITYSITNECANSGQEYVSYLIYGGNVLLADYFHGSTTTYSGLLAGYYTIITIDVQSINNSSSSFFFEVGQTDIFDVNSSFYDTNMQILFELIESCGIATEVLVELLACDNPAAANFPDNYPPEVIVNPEQFGDPNPCTLDIFGCMDEDAFNYSPVATADDGSCILCEEDGINNLFGVFAPNAIGLTATEFYMEISLTDEVEDSTLVWTPEYIITVYAGDSLNGTIVFQQAYDNSSINTYLDIGNNGILTVNNLSLLNDNGNALQEYTVVVEAVNVCTVEQIVVPGWDGCMTPGSLNYNEFATDPTDCLDCTNLDSYVSFDSITHSVNPTGVIPAQQTGGMDISATINVGNLEAINQGVTFQYTFTLIDNTLGGTSQDFANQPQQVVLNGFGSTSYTATFEGVYFQGLGSTNYTVALNVVATYLGNVLSCSYTDSVTVGLYGCTTDVYSGGALDGLSTENYNNIATVDDGTCFTCGEYGFNASSTTDDENSGAVGSMTINTYSLLGQDYNLDVVDSGGISVGSFSYTNGSTGSAETINNLTAGTYTATITADAPHDICTYTQTITIADQITGCIDDSTAQNYLVSSTGLTPNVQGTVFPDTCQYCMPAGPWSAYYVTSTFPPASNFTGVTNPPDNIHGGLWDVSTFDTSAPDAQDGKIQFRLIRGSFGNFGGAIMWPNATNEIDAFVNLMASAPSRVRISIYEDAGLTLLLQAQDVTDVEFAALGTTYGSAFNADPEVLVEFTGLDGFDNNGNSTQYHFKIEYIQVPQNAALSNSTIFPADPTTTSNYQVLPIYLSGMTTHKTYLKYLQGCEYSGNTAIGDTSCLSMRRFVGGNNNTGNPWNLPSVSYSNAHAQEAIEVVHQDSSNLFGNSSVSNGSIKIVGDIGNVDGINWWGLSSNNTTAVANGTGIVSKITYTLESPTFGGSINNDDEIVDVEYDSNGDLQITQVQNGTVSVQIQQSAYAPNSVVTTLELGPNGSSQRNYFLKFDELPGSAAGNNYNIKIEIHYSTTTTVCTKYITDIPVYRFGCWEYSNATNYDEFATTSNPTDIAFVNNCGAICCLPDISGCTQNDAENTISPSSFFTPEIVNNVLVSAHILDNNLGVFTVIQNYVDDGSCEYHGCMNSLAVNYDANANTPCGYPFTYDPNSNPATVECCIGCLDPNAINYDFAAGSDYSGVIGGTDYSGCVYFEIPNNASWMDNGTLTITPLDCDITIPGVGDINTIEFNVQLTNVPYMYTGAGNAATALANGQASYTTGDAYKIITEFNTDNNYDVFLEDSSGNNVFTLQQLMSGVVLQVNSTNLSAQSFSTFADLGYASHNPYGAVLTNTNPGSITHDGVNYSSSILALNGVNTYAGAISIEAPDINIDATNLFPGQNILVDNTQGVACGFTPQQQLLVYPNKWFLKTATGKCISGNGVDDFHLNHTLFDNEYGVNDVTKFVQFVDIEVLDIFSDFGSCAPTNLTFVPELGADSENFMQASIVGGNVKISIAAVNTATLTYRLYFGDVAAAPFRFLRIWYTCSQVNRFTGEYLAKVEILNDSNFPGVSGIEIDIDHTVQNTYTQTEWCPVTMEGFGWTSSNTYATLPPNANNVFLQTGWIGLFPATTTTVVPGITNDTQFY